MFCSCWKPVRWEVAFELFKFFRSSSCTGWWGRGFNYWTRTMKVAEILPPAHLDGSPGLWSDELAGVLWAYRTIVKDTTGRTPPSWHTKLKPLFLWRWAPLQTECSISRRQRIVDPWGWISIWRRRGVLKQPSGGLKRSESVLVFLKRIPDKESNPRKKPCQNKKSGLFSHPSWSMYFLLES